LTLTTFQPLYGKFSDIFGRKLALLVAYFIFGAGCIGCGLAQSMTALVAWRAFSGIGGGGMTTVVSILMSDIIPLRERGKWQGYVNIIYAAGAASGAPLGGLMADSIGWRWAFLLQGPLCFMAFIAVYFILKLPHQSRHHWRKRLRQIDFLGAILLILATSSLLVGLDRGSNVSWSSKITIGMISAAFPLYAIFMLVEHYATNPFAPSHIIFSRSLLPPFLCNFFAFAGYMAMLFYIPLYFQAVNGLSSAQAGVRLIPAIVGSVTGSVGGGLLMQKTGKYYWLTVCAYSMLFTSQIGVLLFSGIVAKSTVGIVLSLALGGLGGGIGVTTTLIALIACADPQDQAIVTACSYLFRSLGSAVGVSLAATIVQLRLRSQLADHLGDGSEAEKIVEGVRQSLEYLNKLPDGIRELVRLCYENSVRMAFVFSATVVVGAVVSSCFLREAQLSRR
jgi:predicted MFS family arabinose efflux permease